MRAGGSCSGQGDFIKTLREIRRKKEAIELFRSMLQKSFRYTFMGTASRSRF